MPKPNPPASGIWTPAWPTRRSAALRLAVIFALLFPLSWAVYALLVGSWRLSFGDEESWRHHIEWMVGLAGTTAIVFLVSLLPVFRAVFNRRTARRGLLGLISLITLAVLFYTEEHWRGARLWQRELAALEARGVPTHFASLIPKPVPDEQNFAAAPIVQSWFNSKALREPAGRGDFFPGQSKDPYEFAASRMPESKKPARREFLDLVAWGRAFADFAANRTNAAAEVEPGALDATSRAAAAPAVLAGLAVDEPGFAALREASLRPAARYPIEYNLDDPWSILIPHLSKLRDASRRLQLRASALLAAERSADALGDVQLILYLANSVRAEPILVSQLVRMECVKLAAQPIWEGLAEHRWTEEQLSRLQVELAKFDILGDLAPALNGERAAGILTVDLVREKGLIYLLAIGGTDLSDSARRKSYHWLGGFVPQGWYYLEGVNYCRVYDSLIDGTFDSQRKMVSPTRMKANTAAMEQELASPAVGRSFSAIWKHRVMASMFLPALNRVVMKAAAGHTVVNEALLACALERYRLANGAFPESLAEIAPKFIAALPGDVFGGQPYQYRRVSPTAFVLYSLGWNERDDGGAPGQKSFDAETGDWVWAPSNE